MGGGFEVVGEGGGFEVVSEGGGFEVVRVCVRWWV